MATNANEFVTSGATRKDPMALIDPFDVVQNMQSAMVSARYQDAAMELFGKKVSEQEQVEVQAGLRGEVLPPAENNFAEEICGLGPISDDLIKFGPKFTEHNLEMFRRETIKLTVQRGKIIGDEKMDMHMRSYYDGMISVYHGLFKMAKENLNK